MVRLDLDNLLWLISYGVAATLVVALCWRRMHRIFPVFTSYLVFGLITDALLYWVRGRVPGSYFNAYMAVNVADFLFQLAVLLEIGRNVVGPVRKSLPRGVRWFLPGLLIAAASLALLFSLHATPHLLSRPDAFFVRLNLGMAMLRLAIFAAIAVFAQVLGIGWRNHVLQLATGLAFYSAVSLIVATLHSSMGLTGEFHALDQLQVTSYLGTLTFWIWSFVRQEAPRREFSPQMQNFLVSIAGSTRSARIAVQSDVNGSASRKR